MAAHEKLSSKSRNHLRSTLRMFLGWCARRDYLAANHRLLEVDGLQKQTVNAVPIDFYSPNELRALLEKPQRFIAGGHHRASPWRVALVQEALCLTW